MKRLHCSCLLFVFPCTHVNVQPLSGGEKKKKKLKIIQSKSKCLDVFFPLELNGIWQQTVSVRSLWGSRSNWFWLHRDRCFQTGWFSYWQCISVSQRGSVAWKCQNRQKESVQISSSWLHKDLGLKSQRQGALRPTFRPPISIADALSYSVELSITFTGLDNVFVYVHVCTVKEPWLHFHCMSFPQLSALITASVDK